MKKRTYNNLKLYLKRRRMTQRELAERMDMDPASISRYVNGLKQPCLQGAIKIAKILECSVEDIWDAKKVEFSFTIDANRVKEGN